VVQLPNRLLLSNTVFDRGSRINGPKETRSAEVDQRLLACRSRSGIFCVAGTWCVYKPRWRCLLVHPTPCILCSSSQKTMSKIFSSFQACKGMSGKNFIWYNISHRDTDNTITRNSREKSVSTRTCSPSDPCNIQSLQSRIACIHGS
jgi:hypothetical protein